MRKLFLGLSALVMACAAGFATAGETLTVGTNAEFPPFEYMSKTNEIVGFDIDLVTAVAKAAGYDVKVVNMSFDMLPEALVTGKIHIAAAGMTVSDERKKKIDFTKPYINAAQVLVVKRETAGFTKIDDIKGKRVAVQLGTTGAKMAEDVMGQNNRNLKQFRKYTEAFTELSLGRVDCIVVDSPVAAAYVSKIRGLKISSPPMSDESFAFGVAKNRKELLDRLNKGLEAVEKDGTYDTILEKWFGEKAESAPEQAPAEADK